MVDRLALALTVVFFAGVVTGGLVAAAVLVLIQ